MLVPFDNTKHIKKEENDVKHIKELYTLYTM